MPVADALEVSDYSGDPGWRDDDDEEHFDRCQQMSGSGRELTLGAQDAPRTKPVEFKTILDSGANVSLNKHPEEMKALAISERHAPYNVGGHAEGSSITGNTRHTIMTSIGGLPPRPTEVITHPDVAENLTSV